MMAKGFTVENWRLKAIMFPTEDAYSVNGNLFAVADGVTRDLRNGKAIIKNFMGALDVIRYYPRPSPAKEVSDIFVNELPLVFRDFSKKDASSLKSAMGYVNVGMIDDYNKSQDINRRTVNYLENDFAGCVASAAFKDNGYVHWGFISDCGIAIFDEKGNLKFRTEDEGPSRFYNERWASEEMAGLSWSDSEARVITRRDFRNNPYNPYSFGVFTGQNEACNFIKSGTEEIKPCWYLITYSDGLEDTVFSGEFSDKLRQGNGKGLKRLCQRKIKNEGTLIHSVA